VTTEAGAEPTPYDVVLYPSYTHAPSHIDGLATQAVLHGLSPAPLTACRVLELGCGNGSNLNPMAYGLPGSTFVGVDYAAGPIEHARRMAAEIGLTNVEFVHADITTLASDIGTFDYVICHGVYSWVPPDVADHILRICGECLAPEGVAFVSYLAYPGSHARQMMREIALYHLRAVEDPAVLKAEARELAAWIAAGPTGDANVAVLQADARRFVTASPDYLFHDDLTEWNVPLYFTQFANAAAAHGLQYLSEADPIETADYGLPTEIRQRLDVLAAGSRLQREQYTDFLVARRFRQTLLTPATAPVRDRPDPSCLSGLFVSSSLPMPEEGVNLSPEVDVRFVSPRGSRLETHYPLGKAALEVLIEVAPERIPFADLETAARARVTGEAAASSTGELQEFLLHLFRAGYVGLHAVGSTVVRAPGDRPRASAVARWQAGEGRYITALTHMGFTYTDELGLALVRLLDGTRDRADVYRELAPAEPALVDKHLAELARLGFLEA
jgi:2-polyprenyl-3-methyl-5-hydroxy-6-metoxy-1,4-benzoquinol methylase/methyltransferase-like protein